MAKRALFLFQLPPALSVQIHTARTDVRRRCFKHTAQASDHTQRSVHWTELVPLCTPLQQTLCEFISVLCRASQQLLRFRPIPGNTVSPDVQLSQLVFCPGRHESAHRYVRRLRRFGKKPLLLAACAAVWGRVPIEAMRQLGSTFTGVEHRIEPVRTLDGVLYYNDSIGTSPTRTIAGLRSFDRKVILIAGGYDKHIPYEPLAPEIIAHVKNLVLMGATGPRIEQAVRECPGFDEAALPIQHADNMQHAVELARAAAKPGDIIILSPASASFDLYPNFEVRGREFKKIVNALK